ncbi:PTS fructose transporter subunit IIB [Streptococcus chenjunshii]|uniref:PTS fructose transporter subunit IIB n=1 Tax=Streptococcus chenjunshii TaxID=2173853 RepID=A0A372KKT4_9STRE|nr:PTS transporter subunit EIIC [Streptococcus chenjunshii]AXQ79093.1 PTS fructose transporter subunit IIB [Streptococcus chenjunshii]RFU49988.1 PTS fructose transporter subunit IIB [Streptococcus chenjunshii]RFU52178.1 PTS fructose transporter subunit IIB [Streptococcus chenjunshii]
MGDTNQQMAKDILAAVGGKENVISAAHCMTRLRLNLKDSSIPKKDELMAVQGVIAVVESGGQYQVVIGQNVAKVYPEFTKLAGIAAEKAIAENLDSQRPKEKWTPKRAGSAIMNYLSGSMTPLIPAMIGAAMFKTVQVVIGPDLLHLVSAKSDMYLLCGFVYSAFFYFLPIFLGFTAAKKLGVSQLLGAMLGALLLVPDFVAMDGQTFHVYGFLPATVHNYGQSILPIILTVWVMSYIEHFFKKIIPDVLSTIFVPFLTLLVIVPVELAALAPLGNIMGDFIGQGLIGFGDIGGFIAVALVAALWEFLVMTGMHQVLILFAIAGIAQNGYDNFVTVAGFAATWAAFGMAFGAFLRIRNKEQKATAFGAFVSGILGGVTEPALYGIGMRYKRPFIALAIGGGLGGLYAGLTGVANYLMGATNFLAVLGFVGGGTANIINGCIGSGIAFFATAVLTYLIGFEKESEALKV